MIVVYYCGFICFEVLVLCNLFRYELTFSVCYLYPVFVDDQRFWDRSFIVLVHDCCVFYFQIEKKERSNLELKSE